MYVRCFDMFQVCEVLMMFSIMFYFLLTIVVYNISHEQRKTATMPLSSIIALWILDVNVEAIQKLGLAKADEANLALTSASHVLFKNWQPLRAHNWGMLNEQRKEL